MASNSIVEEPECRDCVINIPPVEWPECCIYKVPKQLRKVNEEAFTPKLVSIGPIHHGEEELKDMEKHKRRYFDDFFKRTNRSLEELLKIIQDDKDKICRRYSETFDQQYRNKDEFINMILLDAIFIIELFLKVRDKNVREADDQRKRKEAESKKTNCLLSLLPSRKAEKKAEEEREAEAETTNCLRSLPPSLKEGEEAEEEKDYILRKPWLHVGIYVDLMLLENQLPFFVLEKLYMFAFNINSYSCNHRVEGKPIEEHKKDLEEDDAPFIKLSRNYFKGYDPQFSIIGKEVKHFTDLIRYFFGTMPDQEGYLDIDLCATKLDNAGLKFTAVEERHLLEITFPVNKWLKYCPCFNLSWLLACLPCFKYCFPCLGRMQCILEVPPFVIDDSTEALFRNLMALEQCHYPLNAQICNYVILLDSLIDTEKDVQLLVDKKVILNKMGSYQDVATLINKLCLGIVEGNSCYAVVGKEINDYCDNPCNRMMASMKSLYFGDFWRGTATVVGLIVLGFTLWNFLEPYFAMGVDLKQVI